MLSSELILLGYIHVGIPEALTKREKHILHHADIL